MAEKEELGLEVFVEGWQKFDRIMDKLDKSVDGLEKEMKSTTKTSGAFSIAIGTIAANAVMKLGEVLVDVGRKVVDFTLDSIDMAADFQDSMAVLSIAASSTGLTFDELKAAALAVGGDTRLLGVSATGAAESLTGLFKAGLTGTEIFGDLNAFMEEGAELGGALRASIDLAAATELDMVQASDLAAIALATFGGELETETERAAFISEALDDIVKSADASVAEVSDLAAALKNVGPAASGLGIPLEDVNTALAILSTRGIVGAEAGTALKSMLVNLNRPTNQVKDALAALNVSLYDTQGNFVGLPNLVEQLTESLTGSIQVTEMVGGRTKEQNKMLEEAEKRYKSLTRRIDNHNAGLNVMSEKALAKANDELVASQTIIGELNAIEGTAVTRTRELTEEQRQMAVQTIAGSYGMNALNTLMAEQSTLTEDGVNGWDAMNDAIEKAAGTQTIAEARSKTFNARMEALDGIIETLKITIGDAFLPIATQLATWFSDMVDKHGPKITEFFGTVGKIFEGILIVAQDMASGVFGRDYPWEDVFPEGIADIAYTISDAIYSIIDTATPYIEAVVQWVDNNIELQDVLIGLSAVILSVVIPAVVSLMTSAAAIVVPILAIIGAVALLRKAWESDFLGMRTAITEFWENKIKPAFAAVVKWLQINIPIAIATVKKWFEETLRPALEKVWLFIQENVIPIIEKMVEWLEINIPIAIETVRVWWEEVLIPALEKVWLFIQDNVIPIIETVVEWLEINIPLAIENARMAWEEILKPALEMVWEFIKDNLFPLIEALVEFFDVAFTLAVTAMAGLWENVLEPAIKKVWEFIKLYAFPIFEALEKFWTETLKPTLKVIAKLLGETLKTAWEDFSTVVDWAKTNVLDPVKKTFDSIAGAVQSVIKWIKDLTQKLKNITLPDWLTPGSPTPFEIGLRGIADAMQQVQALSGQVFAGMPSSIMVGAGGVSPTASPGTQTTNNITNEGDQNEFNLTTQSQMQPGQLAMEFSTMAMRSR